MATALKTFPVFEVMFNSLVKGVISNDYERVSENCTESINKLNQYMKITFSRHDVHEEYSITSCHLFYLCFGCSVPRCGHITK